MLNIVGNVTQTAALTAAGLQIRGAGVVRLDHGGNEITTLAATHTGSISYTDATGLVVGTVADTAAVAGTSSSGILTDADVKLSTVSGDAMSLRMSASPVPT